MGTVPDLATVRAYVRVPATVLTDDELARMRATALENQLARCVWAGLDHAVMLVVNGQIAVVAINHPTPGDTYRVSWGDGGETDIVAPDDGQAQAQHTYVGASTFQVLVFADTVMPIASAWPQIPSNVPAADISYPDALAQAMLRRVQREIAARNLPLGMVGLDASEYGPSKLPQLDALVEEHERAFRRQVLA